MFKLLIGMTKNTIKLLETFMKTQNYLKGKTNEVLQF